MLTQSPPHQDLIERKMPAWLKTEPAAMFKDLRTALKSAPASFAAGCLRYPEVAKALAQEHERFQRSTLAAQALLAALPPLETFAIEKLGDAIKKEFNLEIDVSKTFLFDAVGYAHQHQQGAAEPENFVRSLKHHALQNFESKSAKSGGMDVPTPQMRSVILDQRGYMNGPPFKNVVDIDPVAFAAMCRELDLGGQYHALIDRIYYPQPESSPGTEVTWQDRLTVQAPVLDTLGQVELSIFRQSLHSAFLQKQVSQYTYDTLLATSLETLDSLPQPQANFSFLKLWQVELTGMVLIKFANRQTVVLYTPQATDTPLVEFPTLFALQTHLRDAIVQDLAVITRHIPDAHKTDLSRKVQDRLMPMTFTLKNIYERVPDLNAELPIVPRAFNRPFRAEMIYQNFTRLRDDARFHAVPTAAMDAKTFHERLAYFESIAFNALTIVGFFIPEVGYLMMAATLLQLGHEVYEGVESWTNDDHQQAFAYLVDVMENVALIAITAAGGRAIRAELGGVVNPTMTETPEPIPDPTPEPIPVETPSFIEELVEVELPDGSTRLWRPDLTPFEHPEVSTPPGSSDELGLYRKDNKIWLNLEGKSYSLKWAPEVGTYRIEHPSNKLAYEPPLRHNGAGAWLHALDRPREWHGMQLFKRIGNLAARFDEQDAERILRVSGIDEAVLRRALSDSHPIPALLEDSLTRFTLDRETLEAMPDASRNERLAAFTERYRQLPTSLGPGAAVLGHVYPRLPVACIKELLHHATTTEFRTLSAGKVPLRIAEEIRLIQQQVRLARAFEGLYLQSVDNPDTDRLILHSMQALQGWQADTTIELHRGTLPASRIDRIGVDDMPARIITHTPQGYNLTAQTPQRASSTYSSLFEALFAALPEGQRQALAPHDITDAQTLSVRIRKAPISRWALRKALKMQRPGPRSPMRLADGRLGYRLSGGGKLPETPDRAQLLSKLEEMKLAPEFTVSAERVLSALESAGQTPEQIQVRTEQLRAERQELRRYLNAAFTGPGRISGLGARSANREEIELALWQHWIHSAVPELETSVGTLRLSRMFIAEFPRQLPDFIEARVNRLQLIDVALDHSSNGALTWTDYEAQLNDVFQHFPNLTALEIERGYDALAGNSEFANCLPLIVRSFPHLVELRLINQNFTLYPLDIKRFASRDQLRHLDLSGNRFATAATFDFPDFCLDYLGLDRMLLDRWPDWLNEAALDRIRTLSLRENSLTRVPPSLSANADGANAQTRILLDGNTIRAGQLLDMHHSQTSLRRRFQFSLGSHRVLDEYQSLREAMDQWTQPSGTSVSLDNQVIIARTQVSQSILDFWERRARDDSMSPWHLDAFNPEDCPPTLPDFFIRCVDIIRLTRAQATAEQLDLWIARFSHITQLTLDGHIRPLARLPEALTRLSSLSRLSVLDQALVIDNQAMRVIARIPALRELDLSGNVLSASLSSLNGMAPRLDRLALRNVGLEHWPDWLDNLMPRYTLDLRENRLTTLPQTILENPPSTFGSTAILLTDNPLPPATMRAAHLSQRYDRTFTFDMDLPFDILSASPMGIEPGVAFGSSLGSLGSTGSTGSYHRHGFAPWTPMLEMDASPWLEGAGSLRQSRDAQWQQIRQAGDADNLLQLITQLTTAVPYRNTDTRPAIIERVWRVLAMAANQPDEREVFDAIAAEAIREGTCPDGILLQFQQVEQMHMIAQTALDTTGADRESRLYRLLRRHFRQERLDEIASARSLHQDAAEVRLAYRRLLASRLDLLSPADEMMFGADVSSADATDAALRIWEAEEGEDFLTFAGYTPFWIDYLREAYAGDFERIETKFQSAVNNLQYDQPEASLDELEAPTRALEALREQQEANLIAELTRRIRAEHH
ncbi:NEL-type E3 ubiquitin ligase domain-containing protein [Pseudomonas soli]|uniref:NEL-type E3 ubiquitin ligase domain-containing protein n=1 Tax=Pseudomonas soli TaxID=1306993 RepID=UPI003806C94F